MKLPLARKLPLLIIALTFASALLVGGLSFSRMQAQMARDAQDRLAGTVEMMSETISREMKSYFSALTILATDSSLQSAVGTFTFSLNSTDDPEGLLGLVRQDMREAYITNNPFPELERHKLMLHAETDMYGRTHGQWHPWISTIAQTMDLADILLVDALGNVAYSYAKRDDFGGNINDDDLTNTGLAQAVRKALTAPQPEYDGGPKTVPMYFSEFEPYPKAMSVLQAFAASPLYDRNDRLMGAVVIAVGDNYLQTIMDGATGLEVDSQTLLVNDEGRTVFLSGDIITDEGATVRMHPQDEHVLGAAAGDTGTALFTNRQGVKLLSAWTPVEIGGIAYGLAVSNEYSEVMAGAQTLGWIILATTLIIAAATGVVGWLIARSIVRPLQMISHDLDEISNTRDLTRRTTINTDDEIGRSAGAVDRLLGFFDETLTAVRGSTEELSSASGTMLEAAQALASNSEVQSSAVEELSSSVNQTASQVSVNADSAKTANELMMGAAKVVDDGKRKVSTMVDAMDAINASSLDIEKIIKVIDEIAFQTNLLALNAAVEAARAGQHGRGFAVVAQEVRNLAGRSAKAARETGELIEKSRQHVRNGVEISADTSESFEVISQNITKVGGLIKDISKASAEQARGVDQVNEAILDISRTARLSSQQADTFATTASQLRSTNELLRQEIAKFRVSAEPVAAAATIVGDFEEIHAKPVVVDEPYVEDSDFDSFDAPALPAPANTVPEDVAPDQEHPSGHDPDSDSRGYGTF